LAGKGSILTTRVIRTPEDADKLASHIMRGNAQMQVSIETITPQIASAYLATSKGNRGLKSAKTDAYARDMIAGNWQENGESVIFDETGALIDGHHRLTACTKSGVAFRSVVVRNVPMSARKTIDMGASRTVGDALSFHGYKNSNHMSAVVLALAALKKGRPRSANLSATEVFDFVQANPLVEQAAVVASRKHLPRSQAICGAIWFVAHTNGEGDKADAFLDVLETGIPSGEGCAAHVARERILRDLVSSKRMSIQDVHRVIIAAWEKFRTGAKVKYVKVPTEYKITGW
jgi:hypothetical protein